MNIGDLKYQPQNFKDLYETPFGEEHLVGEDSSLPNCHRVMSLAKRWILGTLQGSLGMGHTQDYLNEFIFRFNRRNSKSRDLLFLRLAKMSIDNGPTTCQEIISHKMQWY